MREKTEFEHRMNKVNIDIFCIQASHLQKERRSKLEDINALALIEEETEGRVVL